MVRRYKWLFAGDMPQALNVVPDLSGCLHRHAVRCDVCEGTGYRVPEDQAVCRSCDSQPVCLKRCEWCVECSGEGRILWPAWYKDELGCCFVCKQPGVDISYRIYGDVLRPICLPCYIARHKAECGCDLWLEFEQQIMGIMVCEIEKDY